MTLFKLHMIKNYLNEKHDIEIIDKYIKSSPKFKKNSLSLNNIWRGKNINERERSEQEELFELKEIEKRFIFELRQKKEMDLMKNMLILYLIYYIIIQEKIIL